MFTNEPAAMDDSDNVAGLFFHFVDDAIGTVYEFSDGLIAKFRNHSAEHRGVFEPPWSMDNVHSETLGIYCGVTGYILDKIAKILQCWFGPDDFNHS